MTTKAAPDQNRGRSLVGVLTPPQPETPAPENDPELEDEGAGG